MKIISTIFLFIFWQISSAQQSYKIPVVVHIMHLGINDPTNVSDSNIKAAIDTLNKIFAADFRNGSTPTNISFELAKRTPNDNCTLGITRTAMNGNVDYENYGVRYETNSTTCGIDESIIKSNRWNPLKYLNIWIVNKVNNASASNCPQYNAFVSSFPNYNVDKDGIIIDYNFLLGTYTGGIITKATLAHEIGHYLGLYHVFEGSNNVNTCPSNNNNCNLEGDSICDTKPVSKNQNQPPRIGPNSCDNNNPFEEFSEKNLLSYSTESFIITPDQSNRMRDYLQFIPYRQSLHINNNALLPISDLIITEQDNFQYQVLQNTTTSILVKFKETNNSSSPVSGNRVISFHLSQDNILTPGSNGDIFLGDTTISSSLAAQSSSILLQKILSIPNTLSVGQYYLFMSADATNSITECIEDNNFASALLYVTNPQAVASYKYWFDDNFANAVTGFGGFATNNNISSEISVANLTNGIHQFNITFKELGAGWSSVSSSLFYKQQINVQGAAKYQYWFDNDFASAATINITTVNNYNLIQNIPIPNTLSVGQHTIHFRFKIEGGLWSVVTSSLFNYGGILPLKLLSFTVNSSNCNTITLNWETTNEVNFDKFIVQQSIDGINFSDINSINSTTTSSTTKKYALIVPDLRNGNYFYRLKQIDKDGSYSFSSILKQKISCNQSKYSISPNPTKGNFIIKSSENKQITVTLYSISGQRLKIWDKQISNIYSLESFSNGLYILKVENEFYKIIKR
jgi:Pregnancy-associated plasma protein-A/Secretion system C-terminal sorting domain